MIKALYEKHLLPHLIHGVCRHDTATRQRAAIVPLSEGHVLEVGIGSGLNLPFYRQDLVKSVTGVDPSGKLWELRDRSRLPLSFPVDFIQTGAEALPLGSNSIDTIVTTYTLCTIPDLEAAFQEMRRVLKPSGKLLFSEHGLAPEGGVQRWQHRLNPVWRQFSGGCNLNRDIPKLLQTHGFQIEHLESDYLNGWKFASFHYRGIAH